jgi:hypothetical protein
MLERNTAAIVMPALLQAKLVRSENRTAAKVLTIGWIHLGSVFAELFKK